MKGKMREGRKGGEDEKWSRQLEGEKAKLKRNGETERKQHFHFLQKNKAVTSLEKKSASKHAIFLPLTVRVRMEMAKTSVNILFPL